ncbi:elongator complex protein 3 [Xiamenia xianingshaonis]|uniref:tRNA carboxymethyluridine synthase n=1 Tax=Xiamenia xianingshaonis TaxID=2682776 RepID=A0A9E6MPB6_9ACTN|nr:tRNA uridine(34) 5-carboxymethylaminomethyl modification radical SAM/GNAT enzyme Elp3 [Xiamenia xianingshaonis]NHM13793.1 tRNA uridine(34) 5-carboxymethylaminomethyl modification radical SAM/GNAT enzyme Elp3 [Xiamenia xianingshaonis]QTU83655.1 tRNA uridine(34) 5-carboxymethylaminomethyl modification radical SAM/GNAT enzyme Elp3 [Xiamenia xianingshaonis]
METAITTIIEALREGACVDAAWLERLVRARNRETADASRTVAKRRLLPYYWRVKSDDAARFASWNVTPEIERRLVRLLQAKPRRTASGVATVTVLTKPWPCGGDCLFCPSDVRMPKSYLSDEPACQRAERCFFDPYLQVTSRLRVLADMGHPIDKVELIVLGGTWSDYPPAYRRWFASELFRALCEFGEHASGETAARRKRYEEAGLTSNPDELARRFARAQDAVNAGVLGYNDFVQVHYDAAVPGGAARETGRTGECSETGAPNRPGSRTDASPWSAVSAWQTAAAEEVDRWHRANETARCRCVGLVVETRPDLVTFDSLVELRALGCTKVQMGIQSLDDAVLAKNARRSTSSQIARAFALLRLFGFKIHVHAMANLVGAAPAADVADYRRLVTDAAFLPDEVKLYPCALVESSRLRRLFESGAWRPYGEEELVGVLAEDVLATPAYTRISRMIRDIPSPDIMAGNKKTNLRQLVEERVRATGRPVREIRLREIATDTPAGVDLRLDVVPYATSVSDERFLQWMLPGGRIAGFLRLSLPFPADALPCGAASPLPAGCAMIREVHVYGRAAQIGRTGDAAQHQGLGRALVERACAMASEAGYGSVAVISAVGTRAYYRGLGFCDDGLYQTRRLGKPGR